MDDDIESLLLTHSEHRVEGVLACGPAPGRPSSQDNVLARVPLEAREPIASQAAGPGIEAPRE